MMETQVTQGKYEEVIGNNPSRFEGANNPVEQVSWFDAVNYAKAVSMEADDISSEVKASIGNMSAKEYMEYALEHPEAGLFRLPTESEWEYAARGKESGSSKNYPWGNSIGEIDRYAQTSRNNGIDSTKPVGLLQANGFGLKDMIGNVWEWTADWYSDRTFSQEIAPNPKGPENGSSRVLRGGSWFYYNDIFLQAAYRGSKNAGGRYDRFGFRLVRTIQ
jgi:formylglycine-generating enzyme required for sulfatase activity